MEDKGVGGWICGSSGLGRALARWISRTRRGLYRLGWGPRWNGSLTVTGPSKDWTHLQMSVSPTHLGKDRCRDEHSVYVFVRWHLRSNVCNAGEVTKMAIPPKVLFQKSVKRLSKVPKGCHLKVCLSESYIGVLLAFYWTQRESWFHFRINAETHGCKSQQHS
jgi:hypothetical protein